MRDATDGAAAAVRGAPGLSWRSRLFGRDAGGVFRGMLTLATGGVAAKLVGLATIPVITRLYTPAQMGVFTTFVALVAILAPLATLRYLTVLPVPRRDATAANLLALNLCILLLVSIVLGLTAASVGPRLLAAASLDALAPYALLIAPAVALAALYETLSLWSVRHKAYRPLAVSQAGQAMLGSALKIGLGLAGLKPAGLLIGQLAQQGGGSLWLLGSGARALRTHRRRIRWPTMAKLARHFRDMPRYRLPSHLLMMASLQGPAIFAAQVFGMDTAGQLGLALTTMAVPITLLGTSTGNAYFAEISAIGRNEPARVLAITRAVTRRLLVLAAPPTLALAVAGPWLFATVFGASWAPAGEFARLLSIYLMFQFVSSPLANALTLFRRQDLFFRMNAVRFALVAATFLVAAGSGWSAGRTVLVYAVLMALHYAISNRVIYGVIRHHIPGDGR